MRNLSFRFKLIALVVPPCLALVIFGAILFSENLTNFRRMQVIENLSDLIRSADDLTHTLQAERGLSIEFHDGAGALFGQELSHARGETDGRLLEFQTLIKTIKPQKVSKDLDQDIVALQRELSALSAKRAEIDTKSHDSSDILAYYSKLTNRLLDIFLDIASLVENIEVANMMWASINISHAKEYAELERTFFSTVFARKERNFEFLSRSKELNSRQEIYFETYKTFATPSQVELLNEILDSSEVKMASVIKQQAREFLTGQGDISQNATKWWAAQSEVVNLLKGLEDRLNDELHSVESDLKQSALIEFIIEGGVVTLVLMLSLGLVFWISHSTSSALKQVVVAANSIARGDLTVSLHTQTRSDELGELLVAFRKMLDNLQIIFKREKQQVLILTNTTAQMKDGVEVLTPAVNQIIGSVSSVTGTTTETASAVLQSASALEEMKFKAEITRNAALEVSRVSNQANQISLEGEQAVAEVVKGIDDFDSKIAQVEQSVSSLIERTTNIQKVLNTVNEISEQSKLLAVNASIEAVAAGEQGRGFSVLAKEIQSLAEQSKDATDEINKILKDIKLAASGAICNIEQGQQAAARGIERARGASKAIRTLTQTVAQCTQSADEILSSSNEQVLGVEQASLAMTQITNASTKNVENMKQMEQVVSSLEQVGKDLAHSADL